jgi:hypothetical protein
MRKDRRGLMTPEVHGFESGRQVASAKVFIHLAEGAHDPAEAREWPGGCPKNDAFFGQSHFEYPFWAEYPLMAKFGAAGCRSKGMRQVGQRGQSFVSSTLVVMAGRVRSGVTVPHSEHR